MECSESWNYGRQMGVWNISESHNSGNSLWTGLALCKRYWIIYLFNHQTCAKDLACARAHNIGQDDPGPILMELTFQTCGERINKQIIRKYLVMITAMMKIRYGDVKRSDHWGIGWGLQSSGQRWPLWGDDIEVEPWVIRQMTWDGLEKEHVWQGGRVNTKALRWETALCVQGYCD